MTISRALKSLQKKEFINQWHDSIDGRNVNIRAFPQTRTTLKRAIIAVELIDRRYLGRV
jgi:DNA-binding MarR family transcriptional regulator